MSLDSDAATRRAGACARHGQPSSTMKASGYAARHRHAVHALAVAGDPGPSGSLPRDERCARDRLGARACGAGRALWPVLGSVWRPLCAPAGRHPLAPRRLCPTSSPGIGTTYGGFLLGRMGTPAGLLSLSPPGPWRLAPGRPDAPRAHAGERAAPTDLSSAPRDGAHHHPSLPGVVTLSPARSRAHATADGPGVIRSPQRLLDEAQRGVRRSPRAPRPRWTRRRAPPGPRPWQPGSGQLGERPAPVRP